jgi:hypothetical protein
MDALSRFTWSASAPGVNASATVLTVPEFKLPLYGADTERGDFAP